MGKGVSVGGRGASRGTSVVLGDQKVAADAGEALGSDSNAGEAIVCAKETLIQRGVENSASGTVINTYLIVEDADCTRFTKINIIASITRQYTHHTLPQFIISIVAIGTGGDAGVCKCIQVFS